MFVLLREHAANIANVLTLRVDPSVWFGVFDWLMVAASVGKVELDTLAGVNYHYAFDCSIAVSAAWIGSADAMTTSGSSSLFTSGSAFIATTMQPQYAL